MEFKIHQSEIDQIRENLPLADILIDALLASTELNVKVVPDTPKRRDSETKIATLYRRLPSSS